MKAFLKKVYFTPIIAFVLVIVLVGTVVGRSIQLSGWNANDALPISETVSSVPIGGESKNQAIPPYNPNLKDGSGNWDLSGWAPPESKPPVQIGGGKVLNPVNNFVFASAQNISFYSSGINTLSVESEDNVIVSYKLGNALTVALNAEAFDDYFDDSVVVNNEKEVVSAYSAGDMNLDYSYSDEFDFEYVYDANGRISELYIYGIGFAVAYGANGQAETITKNGTLYLEYTYNTNGNIIGEINHETGLKTVYDYDNNRLLSKTVQDISTGVFSLIGSYAQTVSPIANGYTYDGKSYVYSNNRITTYDNGEKVALYTYGETEEYAQRIVSRGLNGNNAAYSYVGTRIVQDAQNEYTINYIINGAGSPIGLSYNNKLYYFAFDVFSNVIALLDENGDAVVNYEYNSLGELVSITGSEAYTVGNKNGYLIGGDYYYDHALHVYYTDGGIYDPAVARAFLSNGRVQEFGNIHLSTPFEHKPLALQLLIEDKVKEVILKTLREKDILATVNAPTKDNYNRRNGAIDIFTLPIDLTNMNFGNLLNGNQAYVVIPNSQRNYVSALTRLSKLQAKAEDGGKSEDVIAFFNEYSPTKGTVQFEGGFIYLNKYVSYESKEDGIIVYEVRDNNPNLYKGKNVYSFDINGYDLFSEAIFRADLWKGFKIAPGFNHEDYVVAENEFYCTVELAGRIAQRIMEYKDETSTLEKYKNTNPDKWNSFSNLADGKQISLGEYGTLNISDIEFKYPSNINWSIIEDVVMTTIMVGVAVLSVVAIATGAGAIVGAAGVMLAGTFLAGAATAIGIAAVTVFLTGAVVWTAMSLSHLLAYVPEIGQDWIFENIFQGNEEAYKIVYFTSMIISIIGVEVAYLAQQMGFGGGNSGYKYQPGNNDDAAQNTKFDNSQLQHETSHAPDFGLNITKGESNPVKLQTYETTLREHIRTSDKVVQSSFQKTPVTVYFNSATSNAVFVNNLTGGFWRAFHMTENQFIKFIINGGVGF